MNRKKSTYFFLLMVGVLSACEDIYAPDIDNVDNALVVEARIEASGRESYIRLSNSVGLLESEYVNIPVSGAKVTLISSDNKNYNIYESEDGMYPVYLKLNPELQYKVKVEYSENVYESSFEAVPKIPELDTVFGIPKTRMLLQGGENDIDNVIETEGIQLYTNITDEEEMSYYRFASRKIIEYNYIVGKPSKDTHSEIFLTIYGWESHFPFETFNLARSPEYSATTNILNHPLCFIEKNPYMGIDHRWEKFLQEDQTTFVGWILILKQYRFSNSGYKYYNDLNSQLNSDGRFFDPLYVQARSNLKCTNNPEQLVLGNFEISRMKEYRFYVRYISEDLGHQITPIEQFYDIPLNGEIDESPDFWQPKN